ncbi:hypothetical protein MTR_6g025095 [Medicago truncatula]|uniref:Reverse transcriptase n=1 Tax=Medicago truncatula TaxID=3880 RepID=A0A072U762_MEDTR|nr:hypothetical protein MTR_6g025095 [Medicago truncatula]
MVNHCDFQTFKDLLGIGRACFEMLRPLGYSLLAEIAHHVWQDLFQSHNCWNTQFIGCPMFILNQKLKHLKSTLKVWNKNTFGNVNDQVKQATLKVDSIQTQLDTFDITDDLLEQEKTSQIELEHALDLEETFWHQKSKIQWHTQGDRNTAYYHRIAKIRNASSLITSISNVDERLNDPTESSDHFVNHFLNLFNSTSNIIDNGMVEEVIPSLFTDRINSILTALPSENEIYQVAFSLNKESASGPDGFGALFYQTFWEIIKSDVSNAVLTNHAVRVTHYRPIAIANFKFKLISKILADRLSKFMHAPDYAGWDFFERVVHMDVKRLNMSIRLRIMPEGTLPRGLSTCMLSCVRQAPDYVGWDLFERVVHTVISVTP